MYNHHLPTIRRSVIKRLLPPSSADYPGRPIINFMGVLGCLLCAFIYTTPIYFWSDSCL
ncbi:hypothetical protein CPB86DRAFT_782441, partial [Serendipita vermifera]